MRSTLVSIVALAGLAACSSSASAQTKTRDYPLSGFDRVDLAAVGDVMVTTGPRFAIHAEGDADAIDALAPVVRDATLVLEWKRGFHVSHGQQKLRIAVTMPRVAGAALSGAGSVRVDRARAPTVDAAMSGSGRIVIDSVEAKMVALHLGGSGEIVAGGRADRIEAQVSGVGSIEAARLAAHDGDLRMAGSGSIKAHADGAVDATVSGVGSIDVTGGARCTSHRSGVGSVDCH